MSKAEAKARPIYVKRVKKVAGGHHGGAWKVAYADFVTAMMAFFMVMWIISMDESVKNAVQGYFQDPVGFAKSQAGSLISLNTNSTPAPSILPVQVVSRQIEEQRFKDIGEK